MSTITLKQQQFSNKTRYGIRRQIIAGMRSKQLVATSFSHTIWNQILCILDDIFYQHQLNQLKAKTYGGYTLPEYILTLKDEDCFYFQIDGKNGMSVRKAIPISDFKGQLLAFPALINMFKEKISINLTRLRNGGFSNQFASEIPAILEKLKRCSQILRINEYLRQFAEAFQRLSERNQFIQSSPRAQINFGLFEVLADCLIESSCFKPRQIKHQGQSNTGDINKVNEVMRNIQAQMSGPVCGQMIGCLQAFRERQDPLKLFINYIYIIGNIFVSLSKQSQQEEAYLKAQDIVLNRFVVIVREIQAQTVALKYLSTYIKNFLDTFSLIIWFIRNEILIKEDLFQEDARLRSLTPHGSLKDNPIWLLVLSQILKAILLIIQKKQLNEMAETHLIDASQASVSSQVVSLLQILLFDFQITNKEAFSSAVNCIFSLRAHLKQVKHHEQLHRKIFDFYFGLTCAQENSEYMERVASEAIYNLERATEYPNGFRICAKFLQSNSHFANSKKAPVIEEMKKSIDSILSHMLGQNRQNICHFLSLLFSVLKAEEYVSTPGPSLLNENRMKTLLELLAKVWEDETSKTDDLVVTLQVLHYLSDREEHCTQLKDLLLSPTYSHYLQFLAMNQSELINSLVYKIHQLLQIE